MFEHPASRFQLPPVGEKRGMRNVWKGLVVGGLTGVVAGLMLDGLRRAAEQAEEAGRAARRHAPDLLERARSVAEEAAEAIKAAGLADKARHIAEEARRVAEEAAEAIRASELPDKARHVTEVTAERARAIDRDKAK